jgi:hypothetical protein
MGFDKDKAAIEPFGKQNCMSPEELSPKNEKAEGPWGFHSTP